MLSHVNYPYPWPVIGAIVLYIYPILAGFNCLSNPCIHGVCIDDLNTTYSCYCIDGYTGIHCQTNWDECWSNPCQNGGICHDGIATFNCSCPPGYVGEFCENDFDECESNPCLNNGTCIDITNGYSCVCPVGYTGVDCEIDVAVCNSTNETRCANGGVCVEGPGLSFTCRCQSGWEGYLCQTEIDECMSAPCQNGAVCIDLVDDYACACLFGFTGKNCQEVVLHCKNNPCQNGALCLTEEGHDVCYCVPDYHGDRCQYQYDECLLGIRCKNGGTCIDGVDSFSCSCPPNLTGLYCECLILGNNELDCTYILTTKLPMHTSTTETSKTITEYITISSAVPNVSTSISYTTTSRVPTIITTSVENADTTIEDIVTIFQTTEEATSTRSSRTENFTKTTLTNWESTTQPTSTIFSTYKGVTNTIPYATTPLTEISTNTQNPTSLLIESTTMQVTQTWSTFLTQEPSSVQTTIMPETTLTTETATIIPENTTDCTLYPCQNGGSCVSTPEGYKCMCPYDAEGAFCEIQLGIKNAAFSGDSYLTHRLTNTSHTDIEFTTKTLSPNGLIFYSNIDATYMTLFLEHGYLKFIFSCGYQTMLLSELSHPVNDGFDVNLKTRLEYSKDFNRCSALVIINNTLTMSGNQTAVVTKLIKPISVLHIGGLPHEKVKDHLFPSTGFMGCISNLKVSGKKVDVFKEAEDGFKISECESLVCLSNPCTNGGTCVEDEICEHSVCDNNPCMYGATCLPFAGNGYICLCPFGRHGHFCENELETSEPYFSSSVYGYSSYAAYTIPISGISSSMELKLKFIPNTMDQISILVFMGQTGQHDSSSDHVAVSFVKGYVMLTWNLGSGPRRIFTTKPLINGKSSYLLQFGRLGRRAWLSVDNLGNVTGRSPGNLVQLDVAPILYLGGHVSPNFSTLPHDLPLHTGFSGCIFDVELKSGNLVVPIQTSRQVTGRAVGQCGTNECHEKLCRNNGACLHHGGTFTCLCQDGWFGPLCSSKYNQCDQEKSNCSVGSTCVPLLAGYECDCAVGKSGNYCDKDEVLSDVSFSGKRSYLVLQQFHFDVSKFTIELELRPLGEKGLILFVGSDDSFLSLNLQGRLLEFRVLAAKRRFSGSDVVSIRSNKLLAMGTWYKIKMGKFGNKLFLYVDNVVNTGLLSNGDVIGVSGYDVFLGGLPDLSHLPKAATTSLPLPFTGCIRQLIIDSFHLPLTREYIKQGRNIADCDGTPCGGDACENGGTCWLDSNLNQHCSCPEPFIGEKCESLPSCEVKSCQNKGRCVGNKCFCLMGYTGAFCETRMTVRTPDFTGQSYLILKRFVNDKKRDLSKFKLNVLTLNFSTADENGLILWGAKNNDFFGIGLEKGYLKVVYTNENKTIVEVPGRGHLADGFWHNLEITFDPEIEMRLDRKMLHVQNKRKYSTSKDILSNIIFYIGGIPNEYFLLDKTFGIFKQNFVGCIQAITFNKEKSITDFSAYDGENVGTCHVF
ncbi:hypothetical protein RN001_008175 [Aquatica leii]|uniref:Protein eyes shut n=1 Tax=Aquatica leii TaxID=1421715 RepID=A0AAN7P9Z5_9COLE|nr:hypothetical protein RN001_008175 [Aquatica leii]